MTTNEFVKCQHCGKKVTREEAVELESGSYCQHLRDAGYTTESLAAHRASLTVEEIPDGWIKVAALHKKLQKEGIPVARMVRAFGGDRALDGPLHPKFKVVYVGRARYLDPWCASSEGLEYLRGLGSTKAVPTTDGKSAKAKKVRRTVKPKDKIEEALLA